MTVAFWFHAVLRGDPFVAKGGSPSYELAVLHLCIVPLLLALGPGRLSLDRTIFGKR
jgi:uncharacterized membrane protein YphA (DoxX/SURF4 family)